MFPQLHDRSLIIRGPVVRLVAQRRQGYLTFSCLPAVRLSRLTVAILRYFMFADSYCKDKPIRIKVSRNQLTVTGFHAILSLPTVTNLTCEVIIARFSLVRLFIRY